MLPTILSQMVVPAPVRAVLTRLQAAGFEAFLVGGCVRDMLRGLPPKDFDVTTSALPEQVMGVFPKVIPTGIQHGTVTVLSSGLHVEVTTFRSEGSYIDGRRPTSVAFHSDVKEDLARRDFTINAMAFDPERQQLVDPFDGQGDLAAQRIRAVGRAEERFAEDGLRALRAARFAAVLGFSLEPSTEAAIPGTLQVFRKVSMERVREEFTKLLLAPRASVGLDVLFRTGLLGAFLPEVLPDFEVAKEAALATPVELEVRLSALLHRIPVDDGSDRERAGSAEALLERLKFPLRVQKTVATLIRYRSLMEGARNEIDARKAVSTFDREMLAGLLSLSEAIRGNAPTPLRALYEKALEGNPPLSIRDLALNGGQIMTALKVGPGLKVGEASRFLLQKVLENPTLNSPSTLVELLADWDRPHQA